MLVVGKRPAQLAVHVVHGIEEALGIGLETDVGRIQAGLEILVLLVEGVLAVGQRYVALEEKRMGRVADDGVIGVLTALGGDGLGRKGVVRLPESEKGTDVARVADFLQGNYVRPEGVGEADHHPFPWQSGAADGYSSAALLSRAGVRS